MSQENVEIVWAICDAFARGDYEGALKRLDEKAEFVSPPDMIAGGRSWYGREGIRQGMTSFMGAWDDYHYEVRNLIDCGDDVLVEGWQRGRGKGSGVEVSEFIYAVYTVRGGRVIRYRLFRDRGQAHEAAGLTPMPARHESRFAGTAEHWPPPQNGDRTDVIAEEQTA